MISAHFSRNEFCCHCGNCSQSKDPTVDIKLIHILENLRSHFGLPVIINSGVRCRKYNSSVGGAVFSKHLEGRASDVVIKGVDPSDVHAYLESTYPDSYGLGKYNTFTHIDSRGVKARWGG